MTAIIWLLVGVFVITSIFLGVKFVDGKINRLKYRLQAGCISIVGALLLPILTDWPSITALHSIVIHCATEFLLWCIGFILCFFVVILITFFISMLKAIVELSQGDE